MRKPLQQGRSRLRADVLLLALLAAEVTLWAGSLAPDSAAQSVHDPSEVVLVLDFSASILEDEANRDRFATALDQIADRVDETAADLVAGDATVTIVQFAARADEQPDCVEIRLLESQANVARLAGCLRAIADAYRAGLSPALEQRIGVDTNYVAAMQRAAAHLPADAVRPAMILFTDGKHDVAGVPVGRVQPEFERLFGTRSPFALLPVGMGLNPAERDALTSGLEGLRVIRDMPACLSGSAFTWPQVVFESPADAGNAVAVALQNVTCTFTVAPSPTVLSATATPRPTPGLVSAARLTAGNGSITVDWTAPDPQPDRIVAYRVRCRTGEGDWIEANEAGPSDTTAVVEGLTNGVAYQCEVAAVSARAMGAWKAASTTATPLGPPSTPGKPIVQARNGAAEIQLAAGDTSPGSAYRYECSPDQGASWPIRAEAGTSGDRPTLLTNLLNGTEYVCRAYAENPSGVSDPSALSDAFRPCGSMFECNPLTVGVLGGVGLFGVAGLLGALLLLFRLRGRGYVVAVVDVVHTANLGYGSRLGFTFVREEPRGEVTDIKPVRGRRVEIGVRSLGDGRFEVTDRFGRHMASSGEPIVIVDAQGIRHSLTLRGFRPGTASQTSEA